MFGIYFNRYDKELEIYKVFSDGSQRRVTKLYEKNNFVHMDIRANNFKYIVELENEYNFFSQNMVGVDLNVLFSNLRDNGMKDLGDDKD